MGVAGQIDRETLLIFPPIFEPEYPYLALPALAGFLRAAGIPVRVVDLNLAAHQRLLSRDYLAYMVSRVTRDLEAMERQVALLPGQVDQYRKAALATMYAPHVLDELDERLEALTSAPCYHDPMCLDSAMRTVKRAFGLISAAWYPATISYGAFVIPDMPWSGTGVRDYSLDPERNPFFSLAAELVGSVSDRIERALLVGLSIVDTEQVPPAFALAHHVHEVNPDVPVVVGGPYFTKLRDELTQSPELFDVVDGFVIGEGETPLLELVRAVAEGRDWSGVPSLVYRERGEVISTPVLQGEDVRTLPLPDFSDLPLGSYWTPARTLPILGSRACYWRKCTFCSHSYVYRRRHQARRVEDVAREMIQARRDIGARFFFFADESLPVPFIRRLGAILEREAPDVRWGGELRLDRGLDRATLAQAWRGGMRLAVFGLESFSDRILGLMRKGVRRQDVLRIVRDCMELGIAVHTWLIVGFPTETLEDALETLSFLTDHPELGANPHFSAGMNRFIVAENSYIEAHPGEFDITLFPKDRENLLTTFTPYLPGAGMSDEEIERVLRGFELWESTLPPAIRRTGRVYSILHTTWEEEHPGFRGPGPRPTRHDTLVGRFRFDLAQVAAQAALPEDARSPLTRLDGPTTGGCYDPSDDSLCLVTGKARERLDATLQARPDGSRRGPRPVQGG